MPIADTMPPARKVPANLAAARKKRHPAAPAPEQPAAQENLAPEQLPAASLAASVSALSMAAAAGSSAAAKESDLQQESGLQLTVAAPPVAAPLAAPPVAAPLVADPPLSSAAASSAAATALVAAPPSEPPDPPRHRKPSGRAPRIGLDGPEAEWDHDVGCWRTPGGSVHEVLHNKKRRLDAEAQRALCVQIDGEIVDASGCVPTQRGVTKLLVVSESELRTLDPRSSQLFQDMRCAHGHHGHGVFRTLHQCEADGCPKRVWGEEFSNALEGAIPGCKRSLARVGREQQLFVWRAGGYWEDVEERLSGTGISVDRYERFVQAEIEAKVSSRTHQRTLTSFARAHPYSVCLAHRS